MIKSFHEFVTNSKAIKVSDNNWNVYCDGEQMLGKISDCEGTNEFEAKEDAWEYYSELVLAVNDQNHV